MPDFKTQPRVITLQQLKAGMSGPFRSVEQLASHLGERPPETPQFGQSTPGQPRVVRRIGPMERGGGMLSQILKRFPELAKPRPVLEGAQKAVAKVGEGVGKVIQTGGEAVRRSVFDSRFGTKKIEERLTQSRRDAQDFVGGGKGFEPEKELDVTKSAFQQKPIQDILQGPVELGSAFAAAKGVIPKTKIQEALSVSAPKGQQIKPSYIKSRLTDVGSQIEKVRTGKIVSPDKLTDPIAKKIATLNVDKPITSMKELRSFIESALKGQKDAAELMTRIDTHTLLDPLQIVRGGFKDSLFSLLK